MADLDLTAAIEAAARMMSYLAEQDSETRVVPWEQNTESYRDCFLIEAREVLTAALPEIERQVREQVAAEIEAFAEEAAKTDDVLTIIGLHGGAHIARGTTTNQKGPS